MRKLKVASVILFSIFILNWNLYSEPEKKEDELARLGLVPFEDRTGSENYAYLSESLTDAINESLLKNFTYNKITYEDIKKAIFNSQQIIIKKSGSLKKIDDPKKDEEWKEIIKDISNKKNLNADVIIYGNYRYDADTNEIVFAVNLYLGLIDTNIALDEIHNPVDNTIFKATDKVAQNIVWEINNMVDRAAKQAKPEPGEAPVEKKPGEKKAITKSVVQGPYNWNLKKIALSGYLGLYGFGSDGVNSYTYAPIPEFYVRFWPIPSLQFTLLGNYSLGADDQLLTSFQRLGASLLAGYSTSYLALHWFAEGGVNVSWIGFDSSGSGLIMFGPEVSTGIDLMVSESYAFGFKVNAQYIFGGTNPVFNVDGSITASLVF